MKNLELVSIFLILLIEEVPEAKIRKVIELVIKVSADNTCLTHFPFSQQHQMELFRSLCRLQDRFGLRPLSPHYF